LRAFDSPDTPTCWGCNFLKDSCFPIRIDKGTDVSLRGGMILAQGIGSENTSVMLKRHRWITDPSCSVGFKGPSPEAAKRAAKIEKQIKALKAKLNKVLGLPAGSV
jgi:hypothetical protein